MVIGSKMARFKFKKSENWAFFMILQTLYIVSKADFVDEIKIDKVRSTLEIFLVMAKFVFYRL